jgi:hypothetical protein
MAVANRPIINGNASIATAEKRLPASPTPWASSSLRSVTLVAMMEQTMTLNSAIPNKPHDL